MSDDGYKHSPPPRPAPNTRQVGGEHYQKQKIQHWDYVIANDIPYMEAQIIKYISRWRDKNGIEDLRKAQHFLDKLLSVEEASEPGPGYVDQG